VSGDTPLGLVEVPVTGPDMLPSDLAGYLEKFTSIAPTIAVDPSNGHGLQLPSIAVVVPTNFGRPKQLLACVEALSGLDYPDFEVVVVDNRREDHREEDLVAALNSLARVRVVQEQQPGISAARNRGVSVVSADVVAFTDDDVRVDANWLRSFGRRFAQDPTIDAVSGMVLPDELETPAQVFFEQSGSGLDRAYRPLTFRLADASATGMRRLISGPVVERSEDGLPPSRISIYETGEFGLGSNMAFRTAVLRDLGGFDTALGVGTPTCGGEDLAMLLDVLMSGRGLAYEPAAIVHHTHRRTFEELETQLKGYGTGFIAMIVSLMLRDKRHRHGVLTDAPRALKAMAAPDSTKKAGRPVEYPKVLAQAELRGMLAGPAAYLRSRREARKWAAA
jgi:GT2 family glycosyltransferase